MKQILIVIDMQKDFVDGSLGTKEAIAILPEVVKEIADSSYDSVFVTMDTHDENYMDTLEGKNLPVPHCIKGTDGWMIDKTVQEALDKRGYTVIEKPTFGSYELVEKLKEIKDISSITMIGICTDICVISNALLIRAAFKDLPLYYVEKACSATSPQTQAASIQILQSNQIYEKGK